jgi:hypothetical protein
VRIVDTSVPNTLRQYQTQANKSSSHSINNPLKGANEKKPERERERQNAVLGQCQVWDLWASDMNKDKSIAYNRSNHKDSSPNSKSKSKPRKKFNQRENKCNK